MEKSQISKFSTFGPYQSALGRCTVTCLYLPERATSPLLVGVSFIPIGCDLAKLRVVKDTHVKTANFSSQGWLHACFSATTAQK